MEWYWWAIIVVVIISLPLKIKFMKWYGNKQKEQKKKGFMSND